MNRKPNYKSLIDKLKTLSELKRINDNLVEIQQNLRHLSVSEAKNLSLNPIIDNSVRIRVDINGSETDSDQSLIGCEDNENRNSLVTNEESNDSQRSGGNDGSDTDSDANHSQSEDNEDLDSSSDEVIDSNDRKNRFQCFWPKCGYISKYVYHLNQHISMHLNDKQYKCNECYKSFRRTDELIVHKKRFHYRLKSHKCFHNNCDKSFVTSSDLKQHIRYKH